VKIDPRLLREAGTDVFTGNELLVKGCLETEGGTHLWTGYPGSPIAGFFDTAQEIGELLRERGIRATIANNEALGAAMVNGSQMHGLRAIALQKSVGVHVAADALALGNLVGAHPEGGAVIVLGDDPWSDSTQVPADSRYICKHLMMPVLEPSDAQELKDWIDLAFKLSRESELYIGYLVTTNQADGGGTVHTRPNHFPAVNTREQVTLDTGAIDLERNVLLPPRTWRKEQSLPERYERLWESARRHGANQVLPAKEPGTALGRLGLVTSAAAYCYLRHALAELGLDGVLPILKVGITYPLDPALVRDFAGGCTDVVVVEERRGFLEEQVVEILNQARQAQGPDGGTPVNVWGKQFPHGLKGIPSARGLNPSKLIHRIGELVLAHPAWRSQADAARIRRELDVLDEVSAIQVRVPARTPTFCPGCPHRDSASVLIQIKRQFQDAGYMRRAHGTGPVDLVFHGDTGCYTMLMFEPTKDLMHNYSGMGLGGGTGAGIDPFIRNKQVVFMGDSTFFHSGQIAISNSLKQGQDITYVLLDNQTTAMTGHQTTPALDEGLTGETTFAQDIDRIVEAMTTRSDRGVTVVRVNPAERESYRQLLEKTILGEGVKVIVADKECGITFHRREAREERRVQRERGFLPSKTHIQIASEACEFCLECTKATGCPGLTIEQTPYGPKMQTDLSWCVADGACTRFTVNPESGGSPVKACPAFEEVVVTRQRAAAPPIDLLDFSQIPVPAQQFLDRRWHGYVAGVGGMGIGTATAVLVLAGHKEGYRVQFCDKKGLAIRNGGVYSMITFAPDGAPYTSNVIPYGKADLILGLDALEAVRAIDPATNQRVGSRECTHVVLNTHKTPTILTLLGQSDFDVAGLEAMIRNHTRSGGTTSCNVSAVSERFFGTQMYANVLMLGIAFQRGLLPLRLASLEDAIRTSFGPAAEGNLKAFQLGRLLQADPASVHVLMGDAAPPATLTALVEEKRGILLRSRVGGDGAARAFDSIVEEVRARIQLPEADLVALVRRLADLIEFEDAVYARRCLEAVAAVHAKDKSEFCHTATRAVIHNLPKVMLIKDEVYVARLLTSEEKYRRDRLRYQVDPARGDRLEYRHLNRPQFRILGFDLSWNMRTRDWMLRVMSRMKWLRRALPDWHRHECEFREWYFGVVAGVPEATGDKRAYDLVVSTLKLPESVSGYREIRYPKMAAARAEGERLQAELRQVLRGHANLVTA
jgi:indolepyruvate ferredoxin oxidoreductase